MPVIRIKCQQCSTWFRGRSDKKFCSSGCKNEFHNTRKIEDNSETKKIRLTLNKNRDILRKCLGREKAVLIERDQLLGAGFNFDYHTHHYTNWKQEEYIFSFDYGYLATGGGKYKVVKTF